MKLFLTYRQTELGDAWRNHFKSASDVTITDTNILELSVDAIVSPANSFGFMEGGLDYQISEKLGWHIQSKVQAAIISRPIHELLVGEAIIVPTGSPIIPWLIVAPTMRVPMQIRETVNAYLAMKAILGTAKAHSDIETIAIPGLGTGIGKLEPEIAAKQMWHAYDEIINGNYTPPASFGNAQIMHRRFNPNAQFS